jgi:hypothetical protein
MALLQIPDAGIEVRFVIAAPNLSQSSGSVGSI